MHRERIAGIRLVTVALGSARRRCPDRPKGARDAGRSEAEGLDAAEHGTTISWSGSPGCSVLRGSGRSATTRTACNHVETAPFASYGSAVSWLVSVGGQIRGPSPFAARFDLVTAWIHGYELWGVGLMRTGLAGAAREAAFREAVIEACNQFYASGAEEMMKAVRRPLTRPS